MQFLHGNDAGLFLRRPRIKFLPLQKVEESRTNAERLPYGPAMKDNSLHRIESLKGLDHLDMLGERPTRISGELEVSRTRYYPIIQCWDYWPKMLANNANRGI